MNEEEMKRAFNVLRLKMFLACFGLAAGFIGFGALVILDKGLISVVGLVVFIISGNSILSIKKKIKDIVGKGILNKLFNETFQDVVFNHNGQLNAQDIDIANFCYPYHTINATDLVHATYKDRNITICDVELVGSEHGENGSHRTTVFHGLWVIYDLEKNFDMNISIREMNSVEKLMSEKGFKTDNKEFNKKYSILSDNVAEAKKFLSEDLMKKIMDFDAAAKAKSNIALLNNGQLHIALNYKRDPYIVRSSNPNVIKTKIKAKLKTITDFLDKLPLEN